MMGILLKTVLFTLIALLISAGAFFYLYLCQKWPVSDIGSILGPIMSFLTLIFFFFQLQLNERRNQETRRLEIAPYFKCDNKIQLSFKPLLENAVSSYFKVKVINNAVIFKNAQSSDFRISNDTIENTFIKPDKEIILKLEKDFDADLPFEEEPNCKLYINYRDRLERDRRLTINFNLFKKDQEKGNRLTYFASIE